MGRCGRGPGEVTGAPLVAWRGDTLVTFDFATARLIFIAPEGQEVRRLQLTYDGAPVLSIAGIVNLSDRAIAIAPSVVASGRRDAGARPRQVIVVDPVLASVRGSAIEVPQVAWTNTIPNRLEHVMLCGGSDQRKSFLVAMSTWAFEATVLDPATLGQVAHLASDVPWHRPRKWRQGVVPGAPYSQVVCTQKGPLLWAIRADFSTMPPRIVGGHMELWSYAGQRLGSMDFGERDEPFLEQPVAANGDIVYFRSNEHSEYPVLRGYRMVLVR